MSGRKAVVVGAGIAGLTAAYAVSPGPEITAALIEPVGSLRFVGEHTAGPFSALMEGAVRSGLRPDVSQT